MDNSIQTRYDKTISTYITEESSRAAEPVADNNKNYKNLIISNIKKNIADINLQSKNKPTIDTPSMDPDTAIVILMNVFNQNNLNDINTASNLLKSNNKFNGELNKEKLIKLKDQIAKIAEEAKKKEQAQTASDIGLGFSSAAAVFSFIGALALTIMTLGLGVPALAAATVGLTMSVLDVGTRIAKATNSTYEDANHNKQPLDITLGGMVKRIVEQAAYDAEKNNIDYPPGSTKENREQKKAEIIMITTLALNIGISLACIACSIVSLKSVASAGKNIAEAGKGIANKIIESAVKATNLQIDRQAAKFTTVVSDTAEIFLELSNSSTEIATGALEIQLAGITKQKRNYDIEIKNIESAVKMVQSDITNNHEFLKNLIEASGKLYEDFSGVLSNYYQSQLQTVKKV